VFIAIAIKLSAVTVGYLDTSDTTVQTVQNHAKHMKISEMLRSKVYM